MILSQRWTHSIPTLILAALLSACGGGGGGDSNNASTPVLAPVVIPVTTPAPTPVVDSAQPALTGNIALDGFNWINYRRGQAAVPLLARNSQIDVAAQAHSNYQKTNNIVDHGETAGKAGFTGADLQARLAAAHYTLVRPYAYGEVISATSDGTGAYMAEELIAAIYHRFVILEPMFKEGGAGSATTAGGYTYFTTDFASSNGYGTGLGRGKITVYPIAGQTAVPSNFFSDQESPDPVPDKNEVGYPISVHADISGSIGVTSFSVRPRGGSDLAVRLLSGANDKETPLSAAAIIPLSPLAANTVYDVSFSGSVDGAALVRNWSFTTK